MMLTLEIGMSYLGLGEPDPEARAATHCAHWHRIGDLTDDDQDLWWLFNATEPAEVAAAARDMRGVWHRFGEPRKAPFGPVRRAPGALRWRGGLEVAMRSWVRVLWMVVGGFIGAYAGYWIGYLLGWSSDAEWPFRVGGGTGAILLSMAMSVLGVFLVRLLVGPPPDQVKSGLDAAKVTPSNTTR